MLDPGTTLGSRYHVLSPIGAGGMGEVYKARDLRLQREVAVKVLPARRMQDDMALVRFEREAQALAALSHPNILTIHDSGTEEGVAFLVMELLQGETLRQRLARAPVAWADAIAWGIQIAKGLAAAHSKGIAHRDLKPENVFLAEGGVVKILDFGLAHLHEVRSRTAGPQVEAERTDPQVVMGTVNYMSPEQLQGHVGDARSDIFSLGCVLYEMLCGSRPFARPTPSGTLAAIMAGELPEPPASFHALPPAVQNAVLRCLRHEPEERFQTALDIAFALEMISSGSALPGRPLSAPWRRGRFGRKAALWALGAAAAVLLASWTFLARARATPITSLAILPFGNVRADPDADYLSDGITESVINSLSQIPRLRVMARSTVFRYRGKDVEPQAVGRDLKVDAVLVGRMVQRGDDLSIETELVDTSNGSQLWGQRYAGKVKDLLAVEERIAGEISENLSLKLTGDERRRLAKRYTADNEAFRLYLEGRYYWNKRTEEGFRKGIDYFQRALERDPSYALAYAGLADSHGLLGAFSIVPPREAMEKAKAAAARALELDETLPEAHTSLALTRFLYDWDFAQAEREFRRSVQLKPGYATAHHWYGEYLIAMGRSPEALAQLRMAAEIDPLSLVIATDQGRALYFARRYDEALRQYRRVLEMDKGFVFARTSLGTALEAQGRFDEAVAEYEEAGKLSGGRAPLGLLARAYALAGRRSEARKRLDDLIRTTQEGYVSAHNVVIVYAALGDADAAFRWLEKAADERSEWMPYLKVDPRMDGLRSDPRFARLIARVGLAP